MIDLYKDISINERACEDEHACDTEKNEDMSTGEGNPGEVLHSSEIEIKLKKDLKNVHSWL